MTTLSNGALRAITQKCAGHIIPSMGYTTLQIGVDDTDSPRGMCTTFLAYMITDMLLEEEATFLDFPSLVRLNPNIPWKTRGNGAVSIKVRTRNASRLKEKTLDLMRAHSDTVNGANPGLVFLEGDHVPDDLGRFSAQALWRLISRQDARKVAQGCNMDLHWLGNGQGLVGSIAAVGYRFRDCTAELLSYRRRERFGTLRVISSASVKRVQDEVPSTFNSYDVRRNRVLITPRGPDPVFYGIRGEDPRSLIRAASMIKTDEQPAGHLIFRSNQGTGDHLHNSLDPKDLRPYDSGIISGSVTTRPVTGPGGNVFFGLSSGSHVIPCALYQKTGIAKIAGLLIPGDHIIVGGGIRRATRRLPRTLNLEFVRVLRLAQCTTPVNPACPQCKRRMKSEGQNQGYRCRICKTHAQSKIYSVVPRRIRLGLYTPAAASSRHLARPVQREGRVNTITFDDELPWFAVYDNSGE